MSGAVRRFASWMLVAVGGLIAAIAGPCTLFYAGGALVELVGGAADPSLAWVILFSALLVGGLPLAAGLTMVWLGLRLLRRPPAR